MEEINVTKTIKLLAITTILLTTSCSNKMEEKTVQSSTNSDEWNLVFVDNFNDTKTAQWEPRNTGEVWNHELQYYSPDNVKVNSGILTLTGKNETHNDKKFTSGEITTHNKFDFKYGKIEVKAKIPKGKGLFPAIWMLPSNTTKTLPEIDIMEALGQEPNRIYMANHWNTDKIEHTSKYFDGLDFTNDYHLYSIEWESNKITWYIDGVIQHTTDQGVPNESMFLRINLAIGGDWPGNPDLTIFPAVMSIDYIKIYQQKRG